MGFFIRGSMGKLTAFAQKLATLPGELPEIADRSADKADKALKKGFDAGTDPYGSGWAARKGSYAHPILKKTRKLKKSMKAVASGLNIVSSYGMGYGTYHQTGTATPMAQRMIIPSKGRGIPGKWKVFMAKIAIDVMREHLSG